jgi:N-acetylneuraminic acid mutarotase
MIALTRRAALAGGAACAAVPAAAKAGAWSPRAPMPWTAQEIYGAVWRCQVVVAGGLAGRPGGIDILDRTAVYDPAKDRWREGPRLPAPTHHPVLASAGDRVYAFGGYRRGEGEWTAVTDVLAFDGERWTKIGDMPGPQSETVALTHDGRVHLIGGRAPAGAANAQWRDQTDTAVHRVFEPKTGRWTQARPAPAARNSAAGAVIGGRLHLVGGRTVAGGNMARLDRYDPARDAWEALRPMPQGSGGLAAAALGGRLLAFGGEFFGPSGSGVHPETWLYDPRADRWSAAAPMRTPRHGLVGVSVGGSVLAIGGAKRASAGDTSGTVEAWAA